MTSIINTITSVGEDFIWDFNIRYNLKLSFYFSSWWYYSFTSITSCSVIGGFINDDLDKPSCSGGYQTLTVGNFNRIVFNKRMNSYIIKI
jgi:hypothetical protein